MANVVIVSLIGVIVGAAAGYIYVAKKRGAKCIGCPDSKSCSGGCGGNCGGCSGCGK